MKTQPLESGNYYHIYNRGINKCDIFVDDANYEHFFKLYEKYVDPIAETVAWCLLKNHFHILLRIKEPHEISNNPDKELQDQEIRDYNPSKQFSHLFNAYAQAFNKRYMRSGGLFQTPFKRKLIDKEDYLKQVIFYIHHNPVKHGFTNQMIDYTWSSYNTIIYAESTRPCSKKAIEIFGDIESFKDFHQRKQNLNAIADCIIE